MENSNLSTGETEDIPILDIAPDRVRKIAMVFAQCQLADIMCALGGMKEDEKKQSISQMTKALTEFLRLSNEQKVKVMNSVRAMEEDILTEIIKANSYDHNKFCGALASYEIPEVKHGIFKRVFEIETCRKSPEFHKRKHLIIQDDRFSAELEKIKKSIDEESHREIANNNRQNLVDAEQVPTSLKNLSKVLDAMGAVRRENADAPDYSPQKIKFYKQLQQIQHEAGTGEQSLSHLEKARLRSLMKRLERDIAPGQTLS